MNTKPNKNYVVLIVDDSPDTLGMLNEAPESTGMTTLVALEGKQAITIAQKLIPDVILLDAIMPGMDGFETCQKLKENPDLKNIPVIFMTGLSDTDNIIKGFTSGGIDYLTKPINPIELIARIDAHLTTARTALSAQQALDFAGKLIFAINEEGEKLWATPSANKSLRKIDDADITDKLRESLKKWLENKPSEDNKLPFKCGDQNFTIIYFNHSVQGEHLVRLVREDSIDEAINLHKHFGITRESLKCFCGWQKERRIERLRKSSISVHAR